MGNKNLPEAQARKELYDIMPPALQKLADEFEVREGKLTRGNLLHRYDMGEKIRTAMEDEATFGVKAADRLADYMGKSRNDMYDLRTLVEKFTRAQVEEYSQRKMTNGQHLTISHLLAVCKVRQAADRKQLMNRVFTESLTVGAVSAEVSAGYDKSHKRRGGRKIVRPTSPIAGIQQLFERTQELNNRFSVWDEVVFSVISELPPDKIDGQMLVKLEDADTQMSKLEENVTQYHAKLLGNITRVRKVVEGKADEVKAVKAEHKKEERKLEGKGKRVGRRPKAA